MQVMLLAFTVIASASGYVMTSFQTMILIYVGGVVFTTFLTIPNGSFFNCHPFICLDSSEVEKHPEPQPFVNVTQKKNSSHQRIHKSELHQQPLTNTLNSNHLHKQPWYSLIEHPPKTFTNERNPNPPMLNFTNLSTPTCHLT